MIVGDPAALRGHAGDLLLRLERPLSRTPGTSPASTTTSEVLTDADLRHSVWTTVLLTVAVVLASLVLGLVLALLLDRRFRGRGIVRTLLIAPFLVVPVAAALLWKHVLYNPEYGLLNGLLHYVGGPQPDWISNTPLLAVEASLVWQWTPFMMLILLAGLQSRDQRADRGGPGRRRERLADLRPPDAPAPAPLPRTGRPAGLDLHRPELRRGLHDHVRRPGHRQPPLHRLPELLPGPRERPRLGRGRPGRHRLDRHRDLRPARGVVPVPRGGVPRMSARPPLRRTPCPWQGCAAWAWWPGCSASSFFLPIAWMALTSFHSEAGRGDQPAVLRRVADAGRLPRVLRRGRRREPLARADQLDGGVGGLDPASSWCWPSRRRTRCRSDR